MVTIHLFKWMLCHPLFHLSSNLKWLKMANSSLRRGWFSPRKPLLEPESPLCNRVEYLLRHGYVALAVLQEEQSVPDDSRVEAFLCQLCLHLLECSCYQQVILPVFFKERFLVFWAGNSNFSLCVQTPSLPECEWSVVLHSWAGSFSHADVWLCHQSPCFLSALVLPFQFFPHALRLEEREGLL